MIIYSVKLNSTMNITISFLDIQDLCSEMPCGGKCLYENQYNRFVCVCPEPFYLDVDGVSCILEKETLVEDKDDIFVDFEKTQPSFPTREETTEIDQPTEDIQAPISATTHETPKEEIVNQNESDHAQIEDDAIIFPGTILPVENSSKLDSTTTSTSTPIPTSAKATTSSYKQVSTFNPVIVNDDISTPSRKEDSILAKTLDANTIHPDIESTTEDSSLEVADQNIPLRTDAHINELVEDEYKISETTVSAIKEIFEDSYDLRGNQDSEATIPDKDRLDGAHIDTIEEVPSVVSIDSSSTTNVPTTTLKEDTKITSETSIEEANEPNTSTKVVMNLDDKLEHSAKINGGIVDTDEIESVSETAPVIKESTTKDFGVDLLTSMLSEEEKENVEKEKNVAFEDVSEEEKEENKSENVSIGTKKNELVTESTIITSSSSTTEVLQATISSAKGIPTLVNNLSTSESDQNTTGLKVDLDDVQEIESVETTNFPLSIEEDEVYDTNTGVEQQVEFQTAQPENIIPSSEEIGDDSLSNNQNPNTATFITDVLKNAEESDDGTITAGISVELSSEAAPSTVSQNLKETSVNFDANAIDNISSSEETETVPIPVTENAVLETTTQGITNLLIPIDDSATVNITIPLIDESANADELEKKLREILNTVSEELDLEENGGTTEDQNSVTIQIQEEDSTDEINSILEEVTTPKEEILKEIKVGTPRKLDFGSSNNQLFEVEKVNDGM